MEIEEMTMHTGEHSFIMVPALSSVHSKFNIRVSGSPSITLKEQNHSGEYSNKESLSGVTFKLLALTPGITTLTFCEIGAEPLERLLKIIRIQVL